MFVLSKILFLLAKPGNLLVLLLAAGVVLLYCRGKRAWRAGRTLVALVTIAAAAAASTSLPDLLLTPLENRFPRPASLPERIDGIIVLGGALDEVISAARGQVTLAPGAARLTETVGLAASHPEARILFTGGSGRLDPGPVMEAELAGRFLAAMAVDPHRLMLEGHSRNTYENALLGKELAAPKPGEHWLLVTSAAHMPRAMGVFRRAGWEVIAYPVDYRTTGDGSAVDRFDVAGTLTDLNNAAKEWLGLAAYRLMGRTDALFPAP
ncbi:MAG: YdcF family protein [Alphaproteobacteria bacterium]